MSPHLQLIIDAHEVVRKAQHNVEEITTILREAIVSVEQTKYLSVILISPYIVHVHCSHCDEHVEINMQWETKLEIYAAFLSFLTDHVHSI